MMLRQVLINDGGVLYEPVSSERRVEYYSGTRRQKYTMFVTNNDKLIIDGLCALVDFLLTDNEV